MCVIIRVQEDDQRRLCRTCGEDITQHARYTRWTQCSYCYWKGRYDDQPPLNDLLRERGELKARIEELESLSAELWSKERRLERELHDNLPLWKRLLGITPRDERLDTLRQSAHDVNRQLSNTNREPERLESTIKAARHVRKQFDAASRSKVSAEKQKQLAEQGTAKFNSNSLQQSKDSEYERETFRIRKKDYKRGNALDNHFRNKIAETVISSFGGCCIHCAGTYDLTLDHFAIPKNEGGNFVLYIRENASIKLNIVVLCRSCNSAKGERPFDRFFTSDEIARARDYQRDLLDIMLNDENTITIIRKWYAR
jgi:5-methylcytosine-specific restriction endonuclease McrA